MDRTQTRQYTLHEILEEFYDVQLELEDARESYELLISDIESAVDEISESLERIHDHMETVEDAFHRYNSMLRKGVSETAPQDLPWV